MNKEITPEQKKEWMEEIKKFLHAESNYPHEFIDGLSTPVQTDWKESTKLLMEAYGDNPKDFPYPQQKASTPATDEQDINFENEATEYAKKYWIPDSIEYTAARLGYKAAARKHSVTPVANKEQGSIYKSVQYGTEKLEN